MGSSPEPGLPPLAAIRCFEAAARLGGFSAAARELNLSQAAVSYQIRMLEDRVGGPLFRRHRRGVELTARGLQLAPAVTQSFTVLRQAFKELAAGFDDVLHVNSTITFAANWLVRRIGAFQVAYPRFAVRLAAEDRMVDFAAEAVDVAIRSGREPAPGLVAHRLFKVAFTPLMSPDLAGRSGLPARPADLLRLRLIEPGDPWWPSWFAAAGSEFPKVLAGADLSLRTQQLAGLAAIAGQGVAMLTPAFFKDELASGRLVQPFPLVHDEGHAYWLVHPPRLERKRQVAAFRDWLLAAVVADAAGG